jgi:hypothetical protein
MKNTDRIELVKKPRKCPTCKSKPVAVVLYGLPAESDELEIDRRLCLRAKIGDFSAIGDEVSHLLAIFDFADQTAILVVGSLNQM